MKKFAITTALMTIFAASAHAELITQQPSSSTTVAQYASMPLEQLTRAAQAGQAPAQFYLASRYKKGIGVKQDQSQAFQWFKKAADQGIPSAQLNVGEMYANGLGVKSNLQQAKAYLMKAAKLGDNRASYNLAVLEERAKNYVGAYQWYELSTRDGMLDFKVKDMSEKKIVQLAANLSQNDMRMARERADRWIQSDE
ncbi:sel1 repeat family protein [Acinetobacter qingfengensis]|uniref:Uncharacterized protein n=1 Tax=Acinetobacter qingfengensis TaxID=1262585 RepID=A0A1E7R171_9GAMM|nr:tetratricopeptide repeat protein [Acinetobacter qingfengensis]KAA8733318.1 sel1 repeat family protein [Acinetobacter qingfengensis]OEY93054.1 hypothetical protein BJI46_04735 [Acinetobacter qingfengensis]